MEPTDTLDLAVDDPPPPTAPNMGAAESTLLNPAAFLTPEASTTTTGDGAAAAAAAAGGGGGKRKGRKGAGKRAVSVPFLLEDDDEESSAAALTDLAMLKPKDFVTCNSSHANIGNNNNTLIGMPLKDFLHVNDMYNRVLEKEFLVPLRRAAQVPGPAGRGSQSLMSVLGASARRSTATLSFTSAASSAPRRSMAASIIDDDMDLYDDAESHGDASTGLAEGGEEEEEEEEDSNNTSKRKTKRKVYSEAKLQALREHQEALFREHDELARMAYERAYTVPFQATIRREAAATGTARLGDPPPVVEGSTTTPTPAAAAAAAAAAEEEGENNEDDELVDGERPIPYYVHAYLKELGAVDVMPPFLSADALEELNQQRRQRTCYPRPAGGGRAAATGEAEEREGGGGAPDAQSVLDAQERWRQVQQQLMATKVRALVDNEVDAAAQEVTFMCGGAGTA